MRSKLKLQLEDLAVDSFDTSAPPRSRGTVFGEQCTCYTNCTCPGCPTCDASCNGTCDASCNGTCDAASCNCTQGEYTCGYSCDTMCTYGWDATCRNIGTCDGNYWGGNCPVTP